MKKHKTIFYIAFIIICLNGVASADWQIQYYGEAARMFGSAPRGNFANESGCNAYWKSQQNFERNNSRCVGYDRSSSGSTDTPSGGSSSANRDRVRRSNTASEAEQQQTGQEQAEQKRAKKEKQEAFDRAQNELRMGLKGGTSTGVPGLKTGTTALPLKGSGKSQSIGLKTYDAAAKEKTIKAIKELNCSAYWGLNSAKAALDGKNEVTKNLDDKYTLARKYGEYSAMAKDGKTVSDCPEVKISVPDVPPPMEVNPQIQLYNYIIQQTRILVPDIIEIQQKIEDTKQRLKNIKKDIADKRQETKQLDKKIITTKNEETKDRLIAEKEEINIEQDELTKQAREVEKEATQLNTKADKQGKTVVDLQKIYDDVRANPERAKELAGKVR